MGRTDSNHSEEVDADPIGIRYLSVDADGYSTIETSFPEFVAGVLESNEWLPEEVEDVDETLLDHEEQREDQNSIEELYEAW